MNAWAHGMLLWSWQSLLLVALVFVLSRLAHAHSAAVRHSFWLIGVLCIAALPLTNLLIQTLPPAPTAVAPITNVAQLPEAAVLFTSSPTKSGHSWRELLNPSLFSIWLVGIAGA